MTRYFIPLSLFVLLVVLLALGLFLPSRDLPSALIGKKTPAFVLPRLDAAGVHSDKITTTRFEGRPWVLNVWASWCVSCRAEHEVLKKWPKNGAVPLVGLNYKDPEADAMEWLKKYGDPYTTIAQDESGRAAIEFGVYGVPETFVIDGQGIVRLRYPGPLTNESLQQQIVPMIKQWDPSFELR